MKLSTNQIKLSEDTQSRVAINETTVNDYVELMVNGIEFPPVTVFYDGNDYWLADGFHRVTAAIIAEVQEISVNIIEGTKRDAVLYSVGCNADHGLRRTNADKRRAVEMLLGDAEWSAWSNYKIAEKCVVSEFLVRSLRPSESSTIKSQIEPQERKVERGGTVYVQDISNIGKSKVDWDSPQPLALTSSEAEEPKSPGFEQWHKEEDEKIGYTYEPSIDDVALSGELFEVDIKPTKMIAMADSLYQMCEERVVNTWDAGDIIVIRSKLKLLQSKIEYLLINVRE